MTDEKKPLISKRFFENRKRREMCCKLMEEFLQGLHEVFPECQETAKQLKLFRSEVLSSFEGEHRFVVKWHKQMKPLYELADHKDPSFWSHSSSLPYIGSIHLQKKFEDPGLSEESRASMWEFIDKLNRLSRIYNAVPTKMLSHLENTALQVVNKVQQEDGSLNLNWSELSQLGRSAMENIDSEDLQEFVSNVKGLARNIQSQNISDIPKIVSDIPGVSDMIEQTPEVYQVMNQLFTEETLNGVMSTMNHFMERIQEFNNTSPK